MNGASELQRRQPLLATAAQICLITILPCLLAMLVDVRLVNGISVWIKPAKFLLSLALYYATLAWIFGYLPRAAQGSRGGLFVIRAALIAGLLEMAWLIAAAVAGVPAHFNRESLVWALLYGAAGVGATTLLLAVLVQGVMIARDRSVDLQPAFRRSLVLGAGLSFAMTLATAFVLASGIGHWVGGTPSDAAGLWLMGWSRTGGDLRVAHFFALHLHQALPLVGWAIVRGGLPRPMVAVHLSAVLMVGWVIFVFVQALQGRPLGV